MIVGNDHDDSDDQYSASTLVTILPCPVSAARFVHDSWGATVMKMGWSENSAVQTQFQDTTVACVQCKLSRLGQTQVMRGDFQATRHRKICKVQHVWLCLLVETTLPHQGPFWIIFEYSHWTKVFSKTPGPPRSQGAFHAISMVSMLLERCAGRPGAM